MAVHALPLPGLRWGEYPQRRPKRARLAERLNLHLRAWLDGQRDAVQPLLRAADARWLARLHAHQAGLKGQPFEHLLNQERARLLHQGLSLDTVLTSLACVALMAERTLGLKPFDTQLLAARAVLDNRLAEMATGEGKTLAVALAAAAAALSGMPVHVITANDYLVQRDAEFARPLFTALGLSVGQVLASDKPEQRAPAYCQQITYVTAKELVFDYLRDTLAVTATPPGRVPVRTLRGLCMAIVDEADALLIDEACVPFLLSGPQAAGQGVSPGADEAPWADAGQGLALARALKAERDFTLDAQNLRAHLTDEGRERLAHAATRLGGAFNLTLHREHVVAQALVAQHLLQRDRHYLVLAQPQARGESAVQIIDPATGRVAPGRSWSQGLHQMVEAKEGCAPTRAMNTLAQITYQRFFTRYHRLGGLSGTLIPARSELMTTYGLSVQRIPLRRPCLRQHLASRLFADGAALWPAVAQRVQALQAQGRPVMVVADSVSQALAASQAIAALGLAHCVLHAAQDAQEAAVVANAGQRGAITVSTQMAGRGTDIVLGPGVAALGGLHVLVAQLNPSRRVDAQVAGRAARQGEPGSVERWLALDMPVLVQGLPQALRQTLAGHCAALPANAVNALAAQAQRQASRAQRDQRARVAEQDERLAQQLAFCAPAAAT
jgi:preprotein translocase subunit SecA